MNRPTPARPFPPASLVPQLAAALVLAGLLSLPGCSNGGGGTGEVKPAGDFVVLRTEPAANGTLFLNEPIRIDFSRPLDLDSVDLTTFSFQVLDQFGNVVAEPPAGEFLLDRSPGDVDIGRRLLFVPRLPTNDSFSNGGFRPGRTYIVQLVGGSRLNGTVIRDANGKGLAEPVTFQFHTADGSTLDQLFRNTVPGGPIRTSLSITPTPDTTGVVLNKLGAPPVEIRLGFNQPLNPSSTNVPVALNTDPLVRDASNRGRVYLEYDDVEFGANFWIPADVDLEVNSFTGATVLLRPLGVLPNNATIRVIVAKSLEDISGESNQANASYNAIFGTFKTRRLYEQQFDSVVEEFADASRFDLEAPFAEPVAEVGPGYVKSGFAFEGSATSIEFDPAATSTVLNTNFTQVIPKSGSPFNVSGGVFNFKSVRIQEGREVLGQGSNPMVWLVSESFTVEGTLSVAGGNGEVVTSTATADEPKAGGLGQCGGGDGGAGSPSTTLRDEMGGTGRGPLQTAGLGGTGGLLSCLAGCNRGSGGGGGSFATQGDPNYKQKVQPSGTFPVAAPTNVQPILQQQTGIGGFGCVGAAGAGSRALNGGVAGPVVFTDTRKDNDFWGSGLDFRRNLRITGELTVPMGGGGGGGGGDLSVNDSVNNSCDVEDPNFLNDSSGGGGGGGGGVLIVKALGPIVVGANGRITADGGHGGGGEASGASTKGGGGGGGAGGMVVLMSATSISISAHGGTYAANDYNFSISADGAVSRTGAAGSPKYPSNLTTGTAFLTTYDAAPRGGFGGMGVVQLMAPTGANADGTNTVLDDNIRIMQGQAELSGAAKQAVLAWRGFPDSLGVLRDDFNNATNIGDNEGDIRPAPILLPVPFGPKSRVRSRWLDTGASRRRAVGPIEDDLPRGVLTPPGIQPGPQYEFVGVDPTTGYANATVIGGRGKVQYPTVGTATNIATIDTAASFLGRPAYRVELTQATLGDVADRYAGYEAEAWTATDVPVGSFRILSHTNRVLLLSPESGAFPAPASKIQLRAKFFKLVTGGEEGLGGSYIGSSGSSVPTANVRIGFAFHRNPADDTAPRYPAAAGTYAYDLSAPAVQEAIRSQGLTFVQWDITFDGRFQSSVGDTPPALGPNTPRPELHWLRLPFRF